MNPMPTYKETTPGQQKALDDLANVIKTWIVTASGPTRMKFSHKDLELSVTIMGYKKIILERKFEEQNV